MNGKKRVPMENLGRSSDSDNDELPFEMDM